MPFSAAARTAVALAGVAAGVGLVAWSRRRRREDLDYLLAPDEVHLADVGRAIRAARFGGRGSAEIKVMTAAWRIAVEANTSEPTLPQRRLTGEAGIGSWRTTKRALDRLMDAGWIDKVEDTDGLRGNRYRLCVPEGFEQDVRKPGPIAFTFWGRPTPERLTAPLGRPRDGSCHGEGLTGDPMEDSWLFKHDAFAYKALGSSAARLYIHLAAGKRTRPELVELTGLSRDTVRRNLQRLADSGLAVDEGPHWRGVPVWPARLDAIAREHGTSGRHEAQARRHEAERRLNVMRRLDVIVGRKADRRNWTVKEDGALVNLTTGELPDVYGQIWSPRPTEPGLVAAWSPVIRGWWEKRRLRGFAGPLSTLKG